MHSNSLHLTRKVVKSKDGTEILAEACGNPSNQAVIFVHGLACASTVFDKIFSLGEFQKDLYLVNRLHLQPGYNLIAEKLRYDARGHARSGKPDTEEGYESIHYAEDFDAVCKAFEVEMPFFAGWSLGGSIGADICTHLNPLPIKGVIWLAGLPYIGDVLPLVATPLVLSFVSGIIAPESPAQALQTRIEFCKTLVAPDRLPSVDFAELSSWVGAASFLLPQHGTLVLGRKQDPTRLKEEGAKGLPLCIIHGKADLQISGEKVVQQMKPHFKDCEVNLLDDIGHSPFWEDPEAVAHIILKFVARVNSS